MKYSIKVNEVRAKEGSNIKGFATVVFGDSFKITNIAILENKDKGELFVSMPRYRSNERDESNGVIYKDVCNPITAEFREELYTNILDAYARIKEPEKEETQKQERTQEMPEFSVTVTPYEREGSNIKGLARIYFENSFIVNNINIVFCPLCRLDKHLYPLLQLLQILSCHLLLFLPWHQLYGASWKD
jgi:DNA-binding cell septation regulator SpoVG